MNSSFSTIFPLKILLFSPPFFFAGDTVIRWLIQGGFFYEVISGGSITSGEPVSASMK